MVYEDSGDADLRPFSGPRHDQRWSNSCVANACIKALEIKRIQKHGLAAHVDLSRLAVYYLARELMSPPETHNDEGTYVSHAFNVLRRFGVPPEANWPFDLDKVNTPPSFMSLRVAYLHKIESYFKIRSTGAARVTEVINCLRAGNPVVFGTNVGDNWYQHYKSKGPLVPLKPVPREDRVGLHAVVIVGYVDGMFLIENSWGVTWGDDGYGLVSPELIASPTSKDFWVAQEGFEPYRE
jgi:C1A family cysteine protease